MAQGQESLWEIPDLIGLLGFPLDPSRVPDMERPWERLWGIPWGIPIVLVSLSVLVILMTFQVLVMGLVTRPKRV